VRRTLHYFTGDIVERVEKKQLFDINDFTGLEWDADIKPHGAPTHLPMPSAGMKIYCNLSLICGLTCAG